MGRLVMAAVAMLLVACGPGPSGGGSTPGPTSTPTLPSASPTATSSPAPTPAPTAVPTAQPTVAPTASPAPSPAPSCNSVSGGDAAASSRIVAVRVGTHAGYDRFVIEFSGSVPSWSVAAQADPNFTLSPKGSPVTLAGTSGVLVTVQRVADWTGYSGPQGFVPLYPGLREARLIQNFEGVTQWGLGVDAGACPKAFQLAAPGRLVVDIPTA